LLASEEVHGAERLRLRVGRAEHEIEGPKNVGLAGAVLTQDRDKISRVDDETLDRSKSGDLEFRDPHASPSRIDPPRSVACIQTPAQRSAIMMSVVVGFVRTSDKEAVIIWGGTEPIEEQPDPGDAVRRFHRGRQLSI